MKSDRPNKYPNLTIRYVRGLDPIIKLMDSNGNVQEVRIRYSSINMSIIVCDKRTIFINKNIQSYFYIYLK